MRRGASNTSRRRFRSVSHRPVKRGDRHLEVADGLLQGAVVVEHHSSELERLDVVLVQHEGFLEALHR